MSNQEQSTHGHDCWGWGPKHYECAVREVKALRAEVAEWKRVASAQAELHGESETRAALEQEKGR